MLAGVPPQELPVVSGMDIQLRSEAGAGHYQFENMSE